MTIKHVQYKSRMDAEAAPANPRWAVISLNEPDAYDGFAQITQGWHSVLKLSFHDVTPDSHGLDESITICCEQHAREIVEYVRRVAPEVDGILVHCRAGVSRSAAVAKWISGEYRIPFDRNYKMFNKHVYQLLIAAGRDR